MEADALPVCLSGRSRTYPSSSALSFAMLLDNDHADRSSP